MNQNIDQGAGRNQHRLQDGAVPTNRRTSKNFFGLHTPSLADALMVPKVRAYVTSHLTPILRGAFGAEASRLDVAQEVCDKIIELRRAPLSEVESAVFDLTEKRLGKVDQRRKANALENRAKLICGQLAPFCRGKALLDYGCGDGQAGELIAARCNMELTAVDVYRNPRLLGRDNFHLIEGYNARQLKEPFADVTVLSAVLHHSSNPQRSFEHALSLTKKGGIMLVIESVNGVTKEDLCSLEPNRREPSAQERALVNLGPQGCHFAAMVFDWLYNRVIHFTNDARLKVPVPFNFQSRKCWERDYRRWGAEIRQTHILGIDLAEIVPEFHVLDVLQRPR